MLPESRPTAGGSANVRITFQSSAQGRRARDVACDQRGSLRDRLMPVLPTCKRLIAVPKSHPRALTVWTSRRRVPEVFPVGFMSQRRSAVGCSLHGAAAPNAWYRSSRYETTGKPNPRDCGSPLRREDHGAPRRSDSVGSATRVRGRRQAGAKVWSAPESGSSGTSASFGSSRSRKV
jgi:hypothetical protein